MTGYAVSAATPFLLLPTLALMVRKGCHPVTLADYVSIRLGRKMQLYVGMISILYMFTFLFAEFTAIGKAMETMSEMDPHRPDGIGRNRHCGLHIAGWPSGITGHWIGAGVHDTLSGRGAADAAIRWRYRQPDLRFQGVQPRDSWSIGSMSYMGSFESGLALVLAITAAEMFSQGNWQRAWASESDEALRRGAWLAAALVLPLVFVMGVLGTVAGQGAVDDPSAAFFYLIDDAGALFVASFIVLAISLACSSIDTLQNAIVASFSRDLSDGSIDLSTSR